MRMELQFKGDDGVNVGKQRDQSMPNAFSKQFEICIHTSMARQRQLYMYHASLILVWHYI